jgi:hypothetical protein
MCQFLCSPSLKDASCEFHSLGDPEFDGTQCSPRVTQGMQPSINLGNTRSPVGRVPWNGPRYNEVLDVAQILDVQIR